MDSMAQNQGKMELDEFRRLTAQLEKLDERIRQLPSSEQFKELKSTVVTRDYMDGKYDGLAMRLTWLERKHDEDIADLARSLREEREARVAAEMSRQEKIGIRITQLGVVLTILTQIIGFAGRIRLLP